ncbi:MAG: c-type cytochrome [Gammaproteobacteria bacterium]|nr:c-type cytochrome [Gammaproteobacteria bacterium]
MMKQQPFKMLLKGVLALAVMASAFSAQATDSREDIAKAQSKPMIRGGIVFRSYCILCHGERGDGVARATKLYGQESLAIKSQQSDYYDKIIRGGGPAVGRSEFMPNWGNELSEEQINDVVSYLEVVTDPVGRGEVVFKTNCVLCHGVKGDGKGRASVLFDPPPANLTKSDKNDDYKRMIITMGGKAMGRSEVMPIWGQQISPQQIDDVVAYLRTILIKE